MLAVLTSVLTIATAIALARLSKQPALTAVLMLNATPPVIVFLASAPTNKPALTV